MFAQAKYIFVVRLFISIVKISCQLLFASFFSLTFYRKDDIKIIDEPSYLMQINC